LICVLYGHYIVGGCMKITEKQLNELCTTHNRGILADTAAGIAITKTPEGYSFYLRFRTGGNVKLIRDGMTASEAYSAICGFVEGVEVGAMSKHVYCPKCNARATLVPEDEFTKPHIFCPICGVRSRMEKRQ